MSSAAHVHGRRRPTLAAVVAVAVAVAVAGALAISSAQASMTTTLGVASARVGSKTERVIVDAQGVTVYDLTGDSATHPLCTATSCLRAWPPVTVKAGGRPSKAAGISGALGTWRHDGFIQLTLAGHPLYTFAGDGGQRGIASGDGVRSFGGVWLVLSGDSATHAGRASGAPPAW